MIRYRTAAVDGHSVFYREAGEPEHPDESSGIRLRNTCDELGKRVKQQ